MTENTWPEWTDALGQVYRPGDFVAYAMISGKSPQLVFARVLQIRKRDSKGAEITEFYWEPTPDGKKYGSRAERPSCKVKVQPLHDARGFYRGTDAKAVTLSIPQNIIKVEPRTEWTDEHHIAGLRELREDLNEL